MLSLVITVVLKLFHILVCCLRNLDNSSWNFKYFTHRLSSSKIYNGNQFLFAFTRMGLLIAAIMVTIPGFLSALSPNYISLVILRTLVGVGVSCGQVYAAWFLEFVPLHKRGTWMVMFWTFWTLGAILEASLAWVSSLRITFLEVSYMKFFFRLYFLLRILLYKLHFEPLCHYFVSRKLPQI